MSGTGSRADWWIRSVLAPVRSVIGWLLLAGSAVAALLFVLGAWNPWDLVVLRRWFGNPALGALVVPVAALLGLWLALPVRGEIRHPWRLRLRLVAAGLALLGLLCWGVAGEHFRFEVSELARSADGSRTLVVVTDRDTPPNSYLRVYAGTGLGQREAGEVGRVCTLTGTSAEFPTTDRIELTTPYGVWSLDLDPVTGAPQQVLGPRCPDGPVPATLG